MKWHGKDWNCPCGQRGVFLRSDRILLWSRPLYKLCEGKISLSSVAYECSSNQYVTEQVESFSLIIIQQIIIILLFWGEATFWFTRDWMSPLFYNVRFFENVLSSFWFYWIYIDCDRGKIKKDFNDSTGFEVKALPKFLFIFIHNNKYFEINEVSVKLYLKICLLYHTQIPIHDECQRLFYSRHVSHSTVPSGVPRYSNWTQGRDLKPIAKNFAGVTEIHKQNKHTSCKSFLEYVAGEISGPWNSQFCNFSTTMTTRMTQIGRGGVVVRVCDDESDKTDLK